jgi:hypothetical protein
VTRDGPRGHTVAAGAVVDDIEIGVTLVARTATLTAIELYAFAAHPCAGPVAS